MTSSDIYDYARSLLLSHPLRKPVIESIIDSMQLPASSHGLDIGCGIGLNTFPLAESLGPTGKVVGLDAEEGFLAKARSLLHNKPLIKERVAFTEGDARHLPFADNSFDWACSIDCVGAVDLDPVILLKEMRRVVRPGGRVFIALWSSQLLLPGYPLLEARLNANFSGIAPFTVGMPPHRHILRAAAWLRLADLADIRVSTWPRDVCAPLSNEIVAALADLFTMRWGSCEKEVTPEIWQDYRRLCDPDSSDFILHDPDYYAFFTYSLFSGRVV